MADRHHGDTQDPLADFPRPEPGGVHAWLSDAAAHKGKPASSGCCSCRLDGWYAPHVGAGFARPAAEMFIGDVVEAPMLRPATRCTEWLCTSLLDLAL
jgi:hypothetical protein